MKPVRTANLIWLLAPWGGPTHVSLGHGKTLCGLDLAKSKWVYEEEYNTAECGRCNFGLQNWPEEELVGLGVTGLRFATAPFPDGKRCDRNGIPLEG